MEAIGLARRGGKTTRIIAEMRKNREAVMVVHSHGARQEILRDHPGLRDRIYTFDDLSSRGRGRINPRAPVYIDNVDLFLQRHFGNVQLFSFSTEEEHV